jgi:hypothetical protein
MSSVIIAGSAIGTIANTNSESQGRATHVSKDYNTMPRTQHAPNQSGAQNSRPLWFRPTACT